MSVAARVADEMDCRLGEEVGFGSGQSKRSKR
jgi:HrpA-like RNA helicase